MNLSGRAAVAVRTAGPYPGGVFGFCNPLALKTNKKPTGLIDLDYILIYDVWLERGASLMSLPAVRF